MTIETGALEQAYVDEESSYNPASPAALSATDGIRHLELSITSKKNREPSPEKRGTPDESQSLPRRQTQGWDLSSAMWEPSGTLGTISNLGKLIKGGMGAQNTCSLQTTVLASPAPSATGCTLAAVTGLQVGDLIAFTVAGDRQITRVKSIAVTDTAPAAGAAITGALAGDGAGNVDDGTHSYRYTYVSAAGESQPSAVSNTVTVADNTMDGQVDLTGITAGPMGTTARKVYRTEAGDAVTGPWKLLTTINDNSTTIFTDNVADSSLGADLVLGAITYDELSAAPDDPGAAIVGITYKLTNNVTHSFGIYKYYTAGGHAQAALGAVVDRIQVTFDGTREVMIAMSGPAGAYRDSAAPDTPQAKPASHTTVGEPVGGMVGSVYIDDTAFPVISCELQVQNQVELRNKELGTSTASGIAGRNNHRTGTARITFYLENTSLIGKAHTVTRANARILIGDTVGSMLGCVMPGLEFEIPDLPQGMGPLEVTIEARCYATDGNDAVYLAEL